MTSKAKLDLMKEIEAKVARKKQFSKQASRQKTVANWVADFFTEYEKIKKASLGTNTFENDFTYLAIDQLNLQLRRLDRKCSVVFRRPSGESPVIEIQWSKDFVKTNNCEEILIFDASSAYFQSALEDV